MRKERELQAGWCQNALYLDGLPGDQPISTNAKDMPGPERSKLEGVKETKEGRGKIDMHPFTQSAIASTLNLSRAKDNSTNNTLKQYPFLSS